MCVTFDWMMTRDKKLSDVVVKYFLWIFFRFSAGCQTQWEHLLLTPNDTQYSLDSFRKLIHKGIEHILWSNHTQTVAFDGYPTLDTHTSPNPSSFALEHPQNYLHVIDTPKQFCCSFIISFHLFCSHARWFVHSFWFDCNFINVKFTAVMQITASKSRRLHSIDSKWLVDILQSIKFE